MKTENIGEMKTVPNKKEKLFTLVSLIIIAASILIISLMSGTSLFDDDSYISFRYAENIVSGKGMVYNQGERVLGVSTPLYVLCLSFIHLTGVEVIKAAFWICTVFNILTLCLVYLFIKKYTNMYLAFFMSLVLILLPEWAISTSIGMETTLYTFLILAVLYSFTIKKYYLCACFSALLVLTRLDGMAFVFGWIVLGMFFDMKKTIKASFLFVVLLLPWLIFSTVYFGSFIPHSVGAKQVVHPGTFTGNLLHYVSVFWNGPIHTLMTIPMLAGVIYSLRKERKSVLVSIWLFLYILAFSMSGIMPFLWYRAPMMPLYIILSSFGIYYLGSYLFSKTGLIRTRGIKIIVYSLLFTASLVILYKDAIMYKETGRFFKREIRNMRENMYTTIGKWIYENSSKGDSIYVGETGVLGWYLRDRYVIDNSGINSDYVYQLRQSSRDINALKEFHKGRASWGSYKWSWVIIAGMKPDFITSYRDFLHLKYFEEMPEFNKYYEKITNKELNAYNEVVYRKKAEFTDEIDLLNMNNEQVIIDTDIIIPGTFTTVKSGQMNICIFLNNKGSACYIGRLKEFQMNYRWLKDDKEIMSRTSKQPLPLFINPGEREFMPVPVKLPGLPGSYILEITCEIPFLEKPVKQISTVNIQAKLHDSFSPGELKVDYKYLKVPGSVKRSYPFSLSCSLTNKGDTLWITRMPYRKKSGKVSLGSLWFKADEKDLTFKNSVFESRTNLPFDMPPGESAEFTATAFSPAFPGKFKVIFGLVDENITWFHLKGNDCIEKIIEVE